MISYIDIDLPEEYHCIEDLGKVYDTDPSKILSKTGFDKLYYYDKKTTSVDVGERLLKKFVKEASIKPEAIIFVTQSPDHLLPSCSCIIEGRMNFSIKYCLDVNMGCSGLVYGLSVLNSLISSKIVNNGVIICCDMYTKFINPSDRSTKTIFSDGGSLSFLEKSFDADYLSFDFKTQGDMFDSLIIEKGAAKSFGTPEIEMRGSDIFMFTQNTVKRSVKDFILRSKHFPQKLFFHQASKMVMDSFSEHFKDNTVVRCEREIGNITSSTIPYILKQERDNGNLKKDDVILLSGFGVGLSVASCILRW